MISIVIVIMRCQHHCHRYAGAQSTQHNFTLRAKNDKFTLLNKIKVAVWRKNGKMCKSALEDGKIVKEKHNFQ